MRVLMLSHLYPRPHHPDLAVFIRRQVAELTRLGVSVRVVSPVPWAPPFLVRTSRLQRVLAQSQASPQAWEIDGIRVDAPRYWKLPGRFDLGTHGPLYDRSVRRPVRRIFHDEGFDLIHAQMLVPDGFAAARLGRELGVPSVATERGYLPSQANGRWWDRRAVRFAIENVDQTVFVARALAELAGHVGEPRREPRVVHTGIDAERFQPRDRRGARLELGLDPEQPIVLLVGGNVVKKGLLVLLDALPRLLTRHPRLALVVIGEGGVAPQIAACIRAARLGAHVRLLGRRPHDELPRWYAAADVVTLPSFREGLPNSLVEAAACARPIVATAILGIPEVVLDGQTGYLVPPGDPARLAEALDSVLCEPERSREMGRLGRAHVVARFSWRRHAEEMLDVYRSVRARPRLGA